MAKYFAATSAFVLSVAVLQPLQAEVTVPTIIADHMVLQRDAPIRLWGKANSGEVVSVRFRSQKAQAQPNAIGKWEVTLSPEPAGGPYELTITGSNTLTVRDIYIGEVWVASGQSNMEWPLSDSANGSAEVAAAKEPLIRFFRFPHKVAEIPVDHVWGKWEVTTPETIADNSAVAYYYARELQQRLHIAVGIIQSAWGGTPAEAWTSPRALAEDASLQPVLAEWANALMVYPERAAAFQSEYQTWQKEAAQFKAQGKVPHEPPRGPLGPTHPYRPSGLFNGMIAPLVPYTIRGVIWYQGEANGGTEPRARLYRYLFPALISDWRRAWGQGDFPFLFVQLSSFRTEADADWPAIREAQRQTLRLRNTAMAVSADIGEPNNIHPKNKKEVGRRLSLAARATVYGENIEYAGPLYRQATREGAGFRLWFDHTRGGLVSRGKLEGFELESADGKWHAAEARIDGQTVLVNSAAVTEPVAARYAWRDVPPTPLYNGEGLPASPFRTGN